MSTCSVTKHLIKAYFVYCVSVSGCDLGFDDASRHDELPDCLHHLVAEAWLAQLFQPLQLNACTLCVQLCVAGVLPGKLSA
jgi:hypothetical protein